MRPITHRKIVDRLAVRVLGLTLDEIYGPDWDLDADLAGVRALLDDQEDDRG